MNAMHAPDRRDRSDSGAVGASCRLCLRDGALQDSHLLPAGLYRRVADPANPHPVLLSDDVTMETSRQICANAFCSSCERRLNRNGEDWVLRHVLQRDHRGFLLRDKLRSIQPRQVKGRFKVVAACGDPSIQRDKLAYFAASILWRASLRDVWPAPHDADGVRLGPYQEAFRRYLLGECPFPDDSALLIAVSDSDAPIQVCSLPYGNNVDGRYHCYWFLVPGVRFQLFVGHGTPHELIRACARRSPEGFMMLSPTVDDLSLRDMSMVYARTKRDVG